MHLRCASAAMIALVTACVHPTEPPAGRRAAPGPAAPTPPPTNAPARPSPPPPIADVAPPPPTAAELAFADQVAPLPLSVYGLDHLPASWLRESSVKSALGVMERGDCWRELTPRVDGFYSAWIRGLPEDERVPYLLHGELTAEQIAGCFGPGVRRTRTKDRRIIAYVADATPHVLATIAPGWVLVATRADSAARLLAEPHPAPNPLRALAPFTTERWVLRAQDYTSVVLGVPSLGLRYTTSDADERVAGTVVFASPADAQTALDRLARPPASDYTDAIDGLRAMAAHGALTRVGATVRYEGTAPPYVDADGDPRTPFLATAAPLSP